MTDAEFIKANHDDKKIMHVEDLTHHQVNIIGLALRTLSVANGVTYEKGATISELVGGLATVINHVEERVGVFDCSYCGGESTGMAECNRCGELVGFCCLSADGVCIECLQKQ